MTRRKRIVFALMAMLIAIGVPLIALLAADLYLHRRVERSAGVNIWGYRGPQVARKAPGEHRLVLIGGSTAFGYGVLWNESIPFYLERRLQQISTQGAPVSVVNLGFNNQGAYGFRFAEEDYLGLDYDAVILYEGYNDLGDDPNEFTGRRESPVFRVAGYYPILYTALLEKAMVIRSGGDLEGAYRGKTVFKPGLVSRAGASTLEAAANVSKALDRQLSRFSEAPRAVGRDRVRIADLGCLPRWGFYCTAVYDGIRFARAHHKRVLVVTQPYIDDRHVAQQNELRRMLASQFGSDPEVRYVNLGGAINMKDTALCYDTMHLTAPGNRVIADELLPAVVALMPEAFNPPAATSVRDGR
jgi:hypothetical protein